MPDADQEPAGDDGRGAKRLCVRSATLRQRLFDMAMALKMSNPRNGGSPAPLQDARSLGLLGAITMMFLPEVDHPGGKARPALPCRDCQVEDQSSLEQGGQDH